MNARQFVELVSRMELGGGEVLDGLIAASREIPGAGAEKGEAKKEIRDRVKAQDCIAVLSRAEVNPFGGYVNPSFAEAVGLERDRLQRALDLSVSGQPYSLKRIFRRKET